MGTVECLLTCEVDPALGVATDRCDVTIGEVKRGEVSFNAAVVDPGVLHAVLRRIGDAARTPLEVLVDQLAGSGFAVTPSAQLRLVAFGRHGSVARGVVIHHDHMVEWLNSVLGRHRDLFEVTNFSDLVLSLLAFSARINQPLAASPDHATPELEGTS